MLPQPLICDKTWGLGFLVHRRSWVQASGYSILQEKYVLQWHQVIAVESYIATTCHQNKRFLFFVLFTKKPIAKTCQCNSCQNKNSIGPRSRAN